MPDKFRSGYVSLIGRPNVGKSTILNAVLGDKIAITSRKPQTTRNRIQGIKTLPHAQIIFIDTPGIHKPTTLLGRAMMKSAKDVLEEIDLVVFVIDASKGAETDRNVLELVEKSGRPVILAINKIDLVNKEDIIGIIAAYKDLLPFRALIPVSADRGEGVDVLLKAVSDNLPEGPRYYPDDMITDQYERFMAAEIIREKIMRRTSDEIPYSIAVEVTEWKDREDGMVSINADIYVERAGQKGIIIGEKGRMLKTVGTEARMEIERLLGTKVFLGLWVKVKKGWRDDKKMLDDLGYK